MDKQIEVIGIDHEWSNMKTVRQVFTAGVNKITTEPAFSTEDNFYGNVLYLVIR